VSRLHLDPRLNWNDRNIQEGRLIMKITARLTTFLLALSLAAIPQALLAKEKAKPAAKSAAASSVDLNSASQKDLEALPGIGVATAKKIIAGRPFTSVGDLSKVGVSAKVIQEISPMVTVGAAPAKPAAKSAPAAAPPTAAHAAAPAAASKTAKSAAAAPATGPVDINTADEKSLEALPGIGPALAKQIIAGRPYKSVDDLRRVKGIGAAKIATLRDKVTVSAAATAPTAAPAPAAAPAAAAPAPAKAPVTTTGAGQAAPAKEARTGSSATPKLAPGEKVNLNTATKEKLDALPEIGPVKAQAIIQNRPYAKIEDVMKVPGIKEGIFAKIKGSITVQ
jgi:competence protein ComEA